MNIYLIHEVVRFSKYAVNNRKVHFSSRVKLTSYGLSLQKVLLRDINEDGNDDDDKTSHLFNTYTALLT